MSRVRVKICGLTRPGDVAAAVRHGADAVGFVFAASPRRLTPERAADLTAAVPDGIMRVGLFLDQPAEFVHAVLDRVALDLLQFHGAEDNAYCAGFGLPFLKAIAMHGADPAAQARAVPDAVGLLLDSHAPGGAGGTGQAFDWRLARALQGRALWLAGGLNPGNVRAAVRALRPYAVDVSSGVETAPGIKSEALIREFVRQAKQESEHDQTGD